MNIDVTKEELLAVVAVSGYIGGASQVRTEIEGLREKLLNSLGLSYDDFPWRKAAALLNSEVTEKALSFGHTNYKTFATLTINNKG